MEWKKPFVTFLFSSLCNYSFIAFRDFAPWGILDQYQLGSAATENLRFVINIQLHTTNGDSQKDK